MVACDEIRAEARASDGLIEPSKTVDYERKMLTQTSCFYEPSKDYGEEQSQLVGTNVIDRLAVFTKCFRRSVNYLTGHISWHAKVILTLHNVGIPPYL